MKWASSPDAPSLLRPLLISLVVTTDAAVANGARLCAKDTNGFYVLTIDNETLRMDHTCGWVSREPILRLFGLDAQEAAVLFPDIKTFGDTHFMPTFLALSIAITSGKQFSTIRPLFRVAGRHLSHSFPGDVVCTTHANFSSNLQKTGAYDEIVDHFDKHHDSENSAPTMCFSCAKLLEHGEYAAHYSVTHARTSTNSSVRYSEYVRIVAAGHMFTIIRRPNRVPLFMVLNLAASQTEAQSWIRDLKAAHPALGPCQDDTEILLDVLLNCMQHWSLPTVHYQLANIMNSVEQDLAHTHYLGLLPPAARLPDSWTILLRSSDDVYLYASSDLQRVDLCSLRSLFERTVIPNKNVTLKGALSTVSKVPELQSPSAVARSARHAYRSILFNKTSVSFRRYLDIVQGFGKLEAMQTSMAVRIRHGAAIGDQKFSCFEHIGRHITPVTANAQKVSSIAHPMRSHGGRAPYNKRNIHLENLWAVCVIYLRFLPSCTTLASHIYSY